MVLEGLVLSACDLFEVFHSLDEMFVDLFVVLVTTFNHLHKDIGCLGRSALPALRSSQGRERKVSKVMYAGRNGRGDK